MIELIPLPTVLCVDFFSGSVPWYPQPATFSTWKVTSCTLQWVAQMQNWVLLLLKNIFTRRKNIQLRLQLPQLNIATRCTSWKSAWGSTRGSLGVHEERFAKCASSLAFSLWNVKREDVLLINTIPSKYFLQKRYKHSISQKQCGKLLIVNSLWSGSGYDFSFDSRGGVCLGGDQQLQLFIISPCHLPDWCFLSFFINFISGTGTAWLWYKYWIHFRSRVQRRLRPRRRNARKGKWGESGAKGSRSMQEFQAFRY